MGPLLLSDTDKHFTNVGNAKNLTGNYLQKANQETGANGYENFVQSDPGMQYFFHHGALHGNGNGDNRTSD